MGTVAPVVSEIFEKTGAYVNRMFLQKQLFLFDKTPGLCYNRPTASAWRHMVFEIAKTLVPDVVGTLTLQFHFYHHKEENLDDHRREAR